MKKIILLFFLLSLAITAKAQIPSAGIPLSANVASGGNFPLQLSGTVIFSSDANRNLVYPETAAMSFKITSSVSLTATRNLIAPLTIGYQYTIENATTGGQSVQIIGSSGTGITIPNGSTLTVWCDGTNYVLSGGGVTGTSLTSGHLVYGIGASGIAVDSGTTTNGSGSLSSGNLTLSGNLSVQIGTINFGFPDNTCLQSGNFGVVNPTSGPCGIVGGLSTNGTPNINQEDLNLAQGTGITLNNSGVTVNISLSSISANTVLGALTATTPSGLALPSCSGANQALNYTNGTGFGCFTISGGAGGTVTSFSAGTLSPLFTTSVTTATSTPALSFTASSAAQNSVLAGPATGGAGAYSFQIAPTISAANMTNFPTFSFTLGSTSISIPGTTTSVSGLTVNGVVLTATGGTTTFLNQAGSYSTPAGSGGTVTSVGVSVPSYMTSTGTPITTNGTIALTFNSQTANTFFASPNGSAGVPGFRAIVAADVPTLPTTILSGTLQAAQEPAHTGDCTNTAGSLALTCTSINGGAFPASAVVIGTNSSSQPIAATTTGTGTTVVLSASSTFTGTEVIPAISGLTTIVGPASGTGSLTMTAGTGANAAFAAVGSSGGNGFAQIIASQGGTGAVQIIGGTTNNSSIGFEPYSTQSHSICNVGVAVGGGTHTGYGQTFTNCTGTTDSAGYFNPVFRYSIYNTLLGTPAGSALFENGAEGCTTSTAGNYSTAACGFATAVHWYWWIFTSATTGFGLMDVIPGSGNQSAWTAASTTLNLKTVVNMTYSPIIPLTGLLYGNNTTPVTVAAGTQVAAAISGVAISPSSVTASGTVQGATISDGTCTINTGILTNCVSPRPNSITADIQSALFATSTMLGPVFYTVKAVTGEFFILRQSGTISCTVAPTGQLMDLGTSATTAYSSATAISNVSVGVSDGVATTSLGNLTAGHYYGFAFSSGTCVTAPTFDFAVSLF